jgi:chitin disaccharide deacetylase
MRLHLKKTLKRTLRQIISRISSDSVQQRLGYPKNTKLLIIHADDLGMSATENSASLEAMEKGMVNSGSVMVPCPGFSEIADYSKDHPNADIGIHLTLTSEWKSYRWKPVSPAAEVPTIINSDGSLVESSWQISGNSNTDEVDKEFRAQINKAIGSGIDLTHIDTHMFTAFSNGNILKKYISLGREFKLPVLLTHDLRLDGDEKKNAVIVDRLYYAKPGDVAGGLDKCYSKILNSVRPGLNCVLIHVAYDNKEMQDITDGQINHGAAWRQSDFDFFTSDKCRQLIEKNKIRLITWREIRDKLIR